MNTLRIDAKGVHYRKLNEKIRQAITNGAEEILLESVNGQRYIGDGLTSKTTIIANGVPGNDLAAFMEGPTIIVNANGQDGIGNTMNGGKVIVRGDAGDIVGHSMRGGKIFVKGDVGYRSGIHMKSYGDSYPVVIIGGSARDFLGEYMAGGVLIVLGLNVPKDSSPVGNYVGTGMHGGTIYVRGKIEDHQLGKEVKAFPLEEADKKVLLEHLEEYTGDIPCNGEKIWDRKITKLIPVSARPYGRIYAY